MSDPYVGEIRMFAGTFAPQHWAFCDGQVLAATDYPALFSLIGATYGGDGRTSFALPDLRGRIPIKMGAGPGLTPRTLGNPGGSEQVNLSVQQMAAHTHAWQCTSAGGSQASPAGNGYATAPTSSVYNDAGPANAQFANSMVEITGGGDPHYNVMPFLAVNFIIALDGTYPQRN